MGIINNFKNNKKGDNDKGNGNAKGKVKGGVMKAVMAALKPVLLIFFKALIPLLIAATVLDWVVELFTADNTPQKIYNDLEIEDVAELIEIKGDETNGYYLDFVDDIDEKLQSVVDEINGQAGYHDLPTNSVEFMKKIIKAEVFTQFPDLRGTIPEGSEDGFQGAVKIRRVTPNKEPGEMKNTGKGPTSSSEEELAYDTIEITDRNDADRIQSWKEGEELYVISRIPMYEQLRETGYWQEKLDEDGHTIYVEKDEHVTYTGKYELDESAMTGEVTVYVEVKKQDGTTGYLQLKSVFAVDESKNKVNSSGDDTEDTTNKDEETVKGWSEGKKLKIKEDIDLIDFKEGDIVTYTGNYEVNDDSKEVYVEVKKGAETAKVIFSKLEEIEEGNESTDKESKTKVAVTSRAKTNSSDKIIGKEGETYRVAIAAGHNNTNDTGAAANGLVEEELSIQVAEKVEELLSEYSNIEVIQTGSTSENPGGIQVGERTTLARNADPDLCIQIHFNAGGGTGVEAIYKDGDGISQQLAEILSETMANAMGLTNRQARTRC